MRDVIATMALGLLACNDVAGISGLRSGDFDAALEEAGVGSTTDATSPADVSSTDANADTSASSDGGSDAGPTLPACGGTDVRLRIAVLSSASGNFSGVVLGATTIAVGSTSSSCFAVGTQIQLRAVPDTSNATHDWGGVVCSAGRRCTFTLSAATSMDVRLQ